MHVSSSLAQERLELVHRRALARPVRLARSSTRRRCALLRLAAAAARRPSRRRQLLEVPQRLEPSTRRSERFAQPPSSGPLDAPCCTAAAALAHAGSGKRVGRRRVRVEEARGGRGRGEDGLVARVARSREAVGLGRGRRRRCSRAVERGGGGGEDGGGNDEILRASERARTLSVPARPARSGRGGKRRTLVEHSQHTTQPPSRQ